MFHLKGNIQRASLLGPLGLENISQISGALVDPGDFASAGSYLRLIVVIFYI
jgi:hypothetical protein